MEESLDNLFNKNKSLICTKDDLRKKLFEKIKYCKFSESLLKEEFIFFDKVSSIINDKEFDELFKKYEKLSCLISSIDQLKKEYEKLSCLIS